MPANRFSSPTTIAAPRGYSHVVETSGPGRTIYVAGQLGLKPDGTLAGGPGDFRAQAEQAFENIKAALVSAGADFSHVVKLNNYLTDIADLQSYFDIRDRYVNTAAPPASTTVAVSTLARPGAVYEIEAIAVVPA